MGTKIDVMTTLCSAFGVFSAFGVAILAFFTAGGGLQRISSWLVRRKKEKAAQAGVPDTSGKAFLRGHLTVWLVASVVALTVLISGIGLFTSFFWLVAVANRTGPVPSWSYNLAQDMFYVEAVVVTVVTVVAIIATALAALPNSRTTTTEPTEAP